MQKTFVTVVFTKTFFIQNLALALALALALDLATALAIALALALFACLLYILLAILKFQKTVIKEISECLIMR